MPTAEQGILEEQLTPAEKVARKELTPVQRAKPYSKYFYQKPVPPDRRHLKLMEKPCDPAKTITPEQISDLLNLGDLATEIGWCNLPNGAGFIANRMKMPGVTKEMIEWWFAWHPLEDLRYKIWYPPQHFGAAVSPEAFKKILAPGIPMTKRFRGLHHHVVEDIGCGPETIDIHFLEPEQVGFDMSRFHESCIATFVGGYGESCPVNPTPESVVGCAIMCHAYRNIPGGLEQRTRFWMGYRIYNGKPDLALPPGVKVPEEAVKGLAVHNVNEFTNLAVILPQIYAEMKDKPLA